jgi:hypothetical protein
VKNVVATEVAIGDFIDINNLFLYSKSTHQQEYEWLKNAFDKGYSKYEIIDLLSDGNGKIDMCLENLPKRRQQKCAIDYFENTASVPDPSDIDPRKTNLFILMILLRKRIKIHHILPRQTIRTNSNLLILFELPFIDMKNIHSDYIAYDMPIAKF